MPKIISNLNQLVSKFSGVVSLLQIITPVICAGAFYVMTLWLDANYVNRPEYDGDKDKTERILEEIKAKLNVLIVGQSGFSVQLNGFQATMTDHSERLRYLERKEPLAKR